MTALAFLRARWRPLLALAAALAAVALGFWLQHEPTPTAPSTAAPPAPAALPSAVPPGQAPTVDIFAVRTWEPPPPPPPPPPPGATVAPAPAAPAQPEAPPLPFQFLGRISEPGRRPAFLLAGPDRVHVATVGASLGAEWRVEGFTGSALIFRHLPTRTRSTLPVGETSAGGKP